ncbi:MAG: bifunctional riboflavin kinase/FAD synthetase [Alphaproteobacteria bacterium]|nr:bifunctional riboflavin kinase/FAD synthetase [Alphaproteobacteria bacterium]
MLLFDTLTSLPPAAHGAVVALGNFDGVHKGHQVVLEKARAVAAQKEKPFGVVTFEPHPRSIFSPADAPFRLTPRATKRRILEELGVDVLFELPFTYDFSKHTAAFFVEELMLNQLNISHAVAGHDFVFGHKRLGTMAVLKDIMQQYALDADEVAPVKDGAHVLWSSTRIREHLESGDVQKAADAMGRPYEIEGVVAHGEKRGRSIGFPTINLPLSDFLRPRFGVYAVRLTFNDQCYDGVANIGVRPTVDGETQTLEAHIFDFVGNLYDQNIRVALVDFIRPEQNFGGLDALKVQIKQDCLVARQRLA